jgi:hypothetical protein
VCVSVGVGGWVGARGGRGVVERDDASAGSISMQFVGWPLEFMSIKHAGRQLVSLQLGTGHWALGTGHWALGTGHWALGTGHWALGTGDGGRGGPHLE